MCTTHTHTERWPEAPRQYARQASRGAGPLAANGGRPQGSLDSRPYTLKILTMHTTLYIHVLYTVRMLSLNVLHSRQPCTVYQNPYKTSTVHTAAPILTNVHIYIISHFGFPPLPRSRGSRNPTLQRPKGISHFSRRAICNLGLSPRSRHEAKALAPRAVAAQPIAAAAHSKHTTSRIDATNHTDTYHNLKSRNLGISPRHEARAPRAVAAQPIEAELKAPHK